MWGGVSRYLGKLQTELRTSSNCGSFSERLEGGEGAQSRQREQPVQRPCDGFKPLRPHGSSAFILSQKGLLEDFKQIKDLRFLFVCFLIFENFKPVCK